jgi:hypothetical protein
MDVPFAPVAEGAKLHEGEKGIITVPRTQRSDGACVGGDLFGVRTTYNLPIIIASNI